jgi:hypothetical protein
VHVVRDFERHPLTQEDADRWGLSLKEQQKLSGFEDYPFSLINPFPENVIPHLPDWTLCQTASSVTNSAVLQERHKESFNPHVAIPVSWSSTDEALSLIVPWCPWLIYAADSKYLTQLVEFEALLPLPGKINSPQAFSSYEKGQRKDLKMNGEQADQEGMRKQSQEKISHNAPLERQNGNHEEKVIENQTSAKIDPNKDEVMPIIPQAQSSIPQKQRDFYLDESIDQSEEDMELDYFYPIEVISEASELEIEVAIVEQIEGSFFSTAEQVRHMAGTIEQLLRQHDYAM